jgi:hypothetical protein
MGDTVAYKKALFHDGQSPKTLEDSVRYTGAYSGVHDFAIQNTIDEGFADLDDWTSDGNGTFALSTSRLSATGGGSSLWYGTRHSEEVAPSFVATFDLVSGTGGFLFRGKDGTLPQPCYVAWWTTTRCGFSRVDVARSPTALISLPHGITAPSRVQVHVRWSLDSVDEDRKWIQMSMFADGACVAGYAEDISGTAFTWDGDYVGFAAYDSDNMIVDNFTVSALTRNVEWTTVDVGQSPGSGMARAIGTTRLSYICRYDNTLRLWRPANRDLDWTVDDGRDVRIDERYSVGSPTHIRVQAAIHEADGFHEADGEARMHRFLLYNDGNIMTEDEAYDEAARVAHDYRERARVVKIALPPNFLLEPQDRIVLNNTDYRVITVATSVQMSESGIRPLQVLECQRYYTLSV